MRDPKEETRIFSAPAARLRLALQEARSWNELEVLCARIDETYQVGGLALETAEELADLAVEMARIVPATDPEETSVLAEELREPGGCPCCGQSAWWEKDGQRLCGVCHPRPAWRLGRRSAA